jgi:hypothetical protein
VFFHKNFMKYVCVAVLAFGLATSSFAQTDVTTSRISGTVRDSNGNPIPGVTVEGRNEETGLVATDVTGSDGMYRLLNLPTGRYTLTASLSGMGTVTRPGLRLVLGSTPSVDFSLSATAAETITVTAAAPIVEVTNTASATTIDAEQLKGMPSGGRDFKQLALLAPQTKIEGERGTLSISGERGINTSVMVDGVDYNNPFFGGAAGGAEGRAPLSLSQESIKEFSVITNGASVEFGRSGGGFVNVITKSGTNQLRGSAFYFLQPQDLIADFANGRKPGDQEKSQFGGSIGGPIMRDRLFFFGSYDQQDQQLTVPINPAVLDADIFAKYPMLASPPEYVQTKDGSVAFGRLDFQATPSQRFMLRGNFVDYDGKNGTSASPNNAESNNGLEGMQTEAYVGQYSATFGSNFINDFNATFVTEDTPRQDKGLGLPTVLLGSFGYGEISFLPIVSTVERTAFSDTFSYIWNDHVLKAGLDYNDTSVDQIFKGNWRGVFVFNNKADLLAGKWAQYRQFGGLGGLTADQAGGVSFGQKETALFIQDQWFVNSNLTVTAGLRWEKLDNPDNPVLNSRSVNANGSFNLDGQIPDVDDQFSPRLGISWSPDANRTVIRAAVGRYWSRTPALLFAQLFSSNGLRGVQYQINVGNFTNGPTDPLSPPWGASWTPVGVEFIDFTQIPTPTRLPVFAIDPDYTNPRTDRATVMVERELARETAVGLELTYAEASHLERLTNLNLQYDGTLGPNGMPRYSSTRPNPFYANITTYVSDAESEYQALSATFRRRFAETFRLYAALTWSEDRDNDSNERNFSGIQAEDVNDLDLNWGYSNRDQRWRGNINGIWDTPWWGIQLAGSYRYNTGSPFTAVRGDDANNDTVRTDRPTIGGVHFGRNTFRQPDFQTLDLRLGKEFQLAGYGSLSLFADCFNCMDEENWFVSNPTWGTGQTPNSSFGLANNPGTPRTIQLAARFDF